MGNIDKSLYLLRKYLAESSIEERSKLWAEVKEMGISGPTVSAYLQSVQVQSSEFNSSFSKIRTTTCDDIAFSEFYNRLIVKVRMQDELFLENIAIQVSTIAPNCKESSAGSYVVYALAA